MKGARDSVFLALAASLVGGCGDGATVPDRPPPYSFTMGTLDGGFPLIFRWPAASLPVRVWVTPTSNFPPIVARSLAVWEEVGLYREFRASLVSDSAGADIIVIAGSPSGSRADGGTQACTGFINWSVAQDTTLVLPVRIEISRRFGFDAVQQDECVQRLSNKFIGHASGLFVPSPDSDDLLFVDPARSTPSLRDRASFGTLYHTTPTVGLPGGR